MEANGEGKIGHQARRLVVTLRGMEELTHWTSKTKFNSGVDFDAGDLGATQTDTKHRSQLVVSCWNLPKTVTQFAVSGAPSRPEGCGLLANEVPGQFERKITTQVPISDEALRAADHPARLAERL